MIEIFQIQNYKALRDVTLHLTPIHVLIGPNDSGKSSILEAIAALSRSVDHPLDHAFTGAWEGKQLVWLGHSDLSVVLTAMVRYADKSGTQQRFHYELKCGFAPTGRTVENHGESQMLRLKTDIEGLERKVYKRTEHKGSSELYQALNKSSKQTFEDNTTVAQNLRGVQSYRWDARFLALPVAPDANRKFRMEPSGFGLALCLDDILGFDRNLFAQLENRFKTIFPEVESIKLIAEPAYKSPTEVTEQVPMLNKSDGKGLYFEFKRGGELVPARQVSDGLLLVLAYLTVIHLPQPPRLLLIEEPENGIHPKRLQEVLAILRQLVGEQSYTQIILTTHSPYVLDHFSPEEVTLCKKNEDGAVSVHPLSQSKTVQDQLDVFTLGEIWTAEGDNALVQSVASQGE